MTAAFLLVALLLDAPSLMGGVSPVSPTQVGEAMTAAEWDESRTLATAFVQRFSETHDLGPLIDEFFADVFVDHLRVRFTDLSSSPPRDPLVDLRALVLFAPSPLLTPRLSDEDLQRYYVHTVNFSYLTALLLFREYTREEIPRRLIFADLLSPESVGLLESEPVLDGVVGANANSPFRDQVVLEDVEEFRRATATLGSVGAIMRSRAARPDVQRAHRYEATIREFDAFLLTAMERGQGERVSFIARATVCGSECRLFPDGTRFVEILAHPALHLHLVESDGRLRIFFIDLPTS